MSKRKSDTIDTPVPSSEELAAVAEVAAESAAESLGAGVPGEFVPVGHIEPFTPPAVSDRAQAMADLIEQIAKRHAQANGNGDVSELVEQLARALDV